MIGMELNWQSSAAGAGILRLSARYLRSRKVEDCQLLAVFIAPSIHPLITQAQSGHPRQLRTTGAVRWEGHFARM